MIGQLTRTEKTRYLLAWKRSSFVLLNVGSISPSKVVFIFNPLTAEPALRALIDFTLSNARRFYLSKGNPLDGKGLTHLQNYLDPTLYFLICLGGRAALTSC